MTGNAEKWTVVVPAMELQRAPAAFEGWLRGHHLSSADLQDDEVRVDVIRTFDGDRMRFLVLTATLLRLGDVTP